MILTIGKQRSASILANNSFITHLAIGDDDTEEAAGDLALGNEIYRVALTSASQDDQVVWGVTTITASDIGDSSYTIKEFGLVDAASGGHFQCRVVLDTPITITGAQKLIIVWGEVFP